MQQGLGDSEIDTQLRIIGQQGKRLEAERWNQILTAEHPTIPFNA